MVLSSEDVALVKAKVDYSDVDYPFNKCIQITETAAKLGESLLNGQIEDGQQFADLNALRRSVKVRFLDMRNRLELKKSSITRWADANISSIAELEDRANTLIPDLESLLAELRKRVRALNSMYEAVREANRDTELLTSSRSTVALDKEQWEEKLGQDLVEKLIERGALRSSGSSAYSVTDNFSRDTSELQSQNENLKQNIRRLSAELLDYKNRWLKDTEVFARFADVLKEELSLRGTEDDGLPSESESESDSQPRVEGEILNDDVSIGEDIEDPGSSTNEAGDSDGESDTQPYHVGNNSPNDDHIIGEGIGLQEDDELQETIESKTTSESHIPKSDSAHEGDYDVVMVDDAKATTDNESPAGKL